MSCVDESSGASIGTDAGNATRPTVQCARSSVDLTGSKNVPHWDERCPAPQVDLIGPDTPRGGLGQGVRMRRAVISPPPVAPLPSTRVQPPADQPLSLKALAQYS